MTEVTYEVFRDDIGLMNASDLCLKSQLYVSGWYLSQFLKEIREGQITPYESISLAKIGNTPIGLCLKARNGFINIFVRKSYRGKGVGSELIRQVRRTPTDRLFAGDGIVGVIHFFDKNNVGTPLPF